MQERFAERQMQCTACGRPWKQIDFKPEFLIHVPPDRWADGSFDTAET